jgi:ABC-type bacteriocin/lantibiotic exporter with double-glycine peptidase domain
MTISPVILKLHKVYPSTYFYLQVSFKYKDYFLRQMLDSIVHRTTDVRQVRQFMINSVAHGVYDLTLAFLSCYRNTVYSSFQYVNT